MTDKALDYENELAASFQMVLREADGLYEGRGQLQKTFVHLSARLEAMGLDHCLVGAFALILHGVRRFTEDIDLLIRASDWEILRNDLIGKGYVEVQGARRAIRDAETGVRIDFVISGQFPGDGKPKPIAFPDPVASMDHEMRIKVVDLKTLVELKLASGMTALDRIQDLADVQRLIQVHGLDRAFAEKLHPYVRPKFIELLAATGDGDGRDSQPRR